MKSVKTIASVSVSLLVVMAWLAFPVEGQFSQADRFRHNGSIRSENGPDRNRPRFTEAPTGFDNLTNGFDVQGPDFETLDDHNVVPLASFNDNRFIFEEREGPGDGLGPTYNAQSCGECHQNVVTGGASQVAEHRTGHMSENVFVESLGGSLIASRATHPDIVELVDYRDDVRTLRIRQTLSAVALSKLSRMRRSWLFAIPSRRRCGEPRLWCLSSKVTEAHALDALDGKDSTPVWCPFPRMPT